MLAEGLVLIGQVAVAVAVLDLELRGFQRVGITLRAVNLVEGEVARILTDRVAVDGPGVAFYLGLVDGHLAEGDKYHDFIDVAFCDLRRAAVDLGGDGRRKDMARLCVDGQGHTVDRAALHGIGVRAILPAAIRAAPLAEGHIGDPAIVADRRIVLDIVLPVRNLAGPARLHIGNRAERTTVSSLLRRS